MFSLLGIFIMIGSNHLLVLYLGLELLTLSSYAMVALRRDHEASVEAAMKYFVLGAMASGFLLYGMSMIYGATGTLDIGEIFKVIDAGETKPQILVFGLVFLVAGLAFKLGAVPFHMWTPDVYHGAPTSITLIIGSAPKLAAFAVVMRLLVDGLLPLAADWQQMLAFMAIASLLIGNLVGVVQTNLKRMLAYSTISHMGFLLLGLMSGVVNGEVDTGTAQTAYSAAMFYVVTYVLTALPAFGIILLLAREGFESEEIADLAGLNQRSPLYAAIMTICMFSLAGIPAGGLLRQAVGARSPGGHGPDLQHRPGRVCRGDVADRCLLLPARGQGHVLRQAFDRWRDRRAHGRALGAVLQRPAGAGAGDLSRWLDGPVCRRHRASTDFLRRNGQ